MTRAEFINNVQYWDDLLNFCNEHGCCSCEDIYSEDYRDDCLNDEIIDMARNADGWRDLCDVLSNVPIGYNYYVRDADEYGGFSGVDNSDFDDYKEDVLEWGDEEEIWDDEYDEDVEEEPVYVNYEDEEVDSDDDKPIEEGCTFEELFAASVESLATNVSKQENSSNDDEDIPEIQMGDIDSFINTIFSDTSAFSSYVTQTTSTN